ncbi:hypothetical protein Ddye_016452 [Dipteronia dyeriana]|uniref:Endonuclease/exonuclease/phosphatase domain-containing protein n=1 Tax=Dipteronia dyeriana TaxID=168575 RepID=A0AAD9X032_9ROSI|nr:hypothetical protein Ddye_016452 [Dipteronia dyeriana]
MGIEGSRTADPSEAMKILVWNVRGMGSSRAFQVLLKLKQAYNPDVLFLMETKVNHSQMERIRVKLGFSSNLVVDCVGTKGVLSLMWSDDTNIRLLSYSSFHMDVQIDSQRGFLWRFTGFYGHPEVSQRQHGWILLRRLHGMSNLLWMCVGDFNEILEDLEKLGGRLKSLCQMTNFRDVLDYCGLQDLGFSGPCRKD